jgi:hypothetical protein
MDLFACVFRDLLGEEETDARRRTKQRPFEKTKMFSLLLSIILTLGGAQGPSGDFNDSNTAGGTVVVTQTTTTSVPVQQKKA